MTGTPLRHKVLAVLPRGETIRNFVYSGALDSMSDDVDVVLASIEPSTELFEQLGARYAGIYKLDPVQERRPVRLARTMLDRAHGRQLWSEAAQERWRRREQESRDSVKGRAKYQTWRALAEVTGNESGVARLSRIERAASRRFPPETGAAAMIEAESPALVFNGSHIHSDNATPVVQAAQWAGIQTATFLFSWDNLTSQGRLLDIYDQYLAWNEAIAEDLVDMYPQISREQVHVTGTPQFDAHFDPGNRWERDRWAEAVGVDPSRPVVLYTTGMPNHMPGEPEIVELIADLLAADTHVGAQLLVRVYAKDRTGRFDELRRRRPDIVFSPVPWLAEWLTPLPEDTPLWTSTLAHVELGINVASTVSLELCMFDKPVLNVAFNPPSVPRSEIDYARYYRFDHYRTVVASGAIDLTHSPDELAIQLREGLRDPTRATVARAALLHSMFGDTLDGRSHVRVAAVLRSLLGMSG